MLNPDAFLRQEIESASPAKLRLMLIRKALGLSELVRQQWESGEFMNSKQWTLRIDEILTELLAGVTDRNHPAATPISDLYIFLGKLMLQADQTKDPTLLKSVRDILALELDTWQQFVQKETSGSLPAVSDSSAELSPIPIPTRLRTPAQTWNESASQTSLNLEV